MNKRYKIEIDTLTDAQNFAAAIRTVDGNVYLEDGTGFRVNAKSVLGAIASTEWSELYCLAEKEIYDVIKQWVVG